MPPTTNSLLDEVDAAAILVASLVFPTNFRKSEEEPVQVSGARQRFALAAVSGWAWLWKVYVRRKIETRTPQSLYKRVKVGVRY